MPNKRIMKKQYLRWVQTRDQKKPNKKNHIDWNRELLTVGGRVKPGIKNYYRHMVCSKKYTAILLNSFKRSDINKRIFNQVTGSSIIEKEMSQSMIVTLPESGLKVEVVKDRYSPYVSWKGVPPHMRLAALYNAAYPTKLKMTDDEAAMYLHNCMGEVRRINGKNLYIDNIFADVIDSTQYNIHHGHQMMQQVLYDLRKRLVENWEKGGIPVGGFPDVDVSIPEDIIEEIKKEAKAAIDDILGLSKEEEK